MNHYVPDFEMDDHYTIPTSSSLTRPKKSAMAEDQIMELLWQNGQVVMQSQTQQRSLKKPAPPPPPHSKYDDAVLPTDHPSGEIRPGPTDQPHQQQLFMQEEEMASWLHYPLNEANFDQDICAADLLFPPPTSTTSAAAAPCITTATTSNFRSLQGHDPRAVSNSSSRPPIPPSRRPEVVQNFSLFSRHRGAPAAAPPREPSESVPSNLRSAVARESTVVDSSDTPTPAAVASEARTSGAKVHGAARSTTAGASSGGDNACGAVSCAVLAGTSSAPAIGASNINTTATTNNNTNTNNNNSREMGMTSCEMTVTSSSPGGSSASASASAEPPPAAQKLTPPEARKRKGKDEDADWHSEDAEFESGDAKKQARGSTSTKRSRAAEVHNLSERRRRDRINEKMRALQELIPRCNKSDKASMLDEAIEYLKSLQLQVQMMSMGCGMFPMMFPGVRQYMPPMGMGMGMGMDMNMSRPMMPFPNVLAGAPMPTPATAAHLGPSFPMPAFHMPPPAAAAAAASDPSRIQAANQSDPMLSSLGAQNPNQPPVPNFVDPYQQFLSLHQTQFPVPQNQVVAKPGASNPSASRGAENLENNQSGT